MQQRAAPTPAEALEALRATKGAASVIERVPAVGQPEMWGEAAFWNVCKSRGEAQNEVFLWDCDFLGGSWNMFDAYANCIAYFAGADEFGEVVFPNTLTGQVWCYMHAPSAGYYVFVPQVQTYPDEPGYVAVVECLIDSSSFGELTLHSGPAVDQPFLAKLAAGYHRFQITQVRGAFFFESLTAWYVSPVEYIE